MDQLVKGQILLSRLGRCLRRRRFTRVTMLAYPQGGRLQAGRPYAPPRLLDRQLSRAVTVLAYPLGRRKK